MTTLDEAIDPDDNHLFLGPGESFAGGEVTSSVARLRGECWLVPTRRSSELVRASSHNINHRMTSWTRCDIRTTRMKSATLERSWTPAL